MSDSYFHNDALVSSVIDDLTRDLDDYNNRITELVTLVNTMSESSSWKDNVVKSAYIKTCNDYIQEYVDNHPLFLGHIGHTDYVLDDIWFNTIAEYETDMLLELIAEEKASTP